MYTLYIYKRYCVYTYIYICTCVCIFNALKLNLDICKVKKISHSGVFISKRFNKCGYVNRKVLS